MAHNTVITRNEAVNWEIIVQSPFKCPLSGGKKALGKFPDLSPLKQFPLDPYKELNPNNTEW